MGIYKNIFLIFFNIFLSFTLWENISYAEIHSSQDLSVITYRISGNRDKSFYPFNQTQFLYEGTVNFTEKTSNNIGEWYGNMFYRLTNDKLVDPEDASLEQMTMGYKGKHLEFAFGDSSVNFSNYSVTNALKGILLELKDDASSKFSIVAGIDTSSWDNLWFDRKDDGPTQRYIWGSRFEKIFLKDSSLSIGFNYGGGIDNPSYFTETDIHKDIQVFSTDLKYQITKALFIQGEAAQSYRKAHTGGDISYDPKWDSAYKVSLDLMKEKYSSRIEYSRAGPQFETTGGFASQDLESLQINGNILMIKNINISPYLYLSKDNLRNHKDTTSKQINPGIFFSYSLPNNIILTSGFDSRKEFKKDKTSSNITQTGNIGITKTFKMISTTLNYARAYIRDHVNPDQERNQDTISFNLNGTFIIKEKTHISWDLGEHISLEHNIAADDQNLLWTHSAGIHLTLPKELSLNGNILLTDNNFYNDENDSDISQYFLSISKNIKERLTASLEYSYNNNNFIDQGNDYREKKLTAKLTCKF